MIELVDASPETEVDPAEYRRLLGYPPGHEMSELAQELATSTREWYRNHGRPWLYARRVDRCDIDSAGFTSQRLSTMLRQAEAHCAFVVAVSAGPEAEQHAHKLWIEEKPDEYFFLETYASAVVEHLIAAAGARLCSWAGSQSLAVLPHASPGYSHWDIGEQTQLLQLVQSEAALPGSLETLDSGALRPQKSQLAVFGVTRHIDRVRPLASLTPCQSCSLANCQFRRAPVASYFTNTKALARWVAERLSLETHADGTVEARFRYDGTTCTNMGRPLAFQYDVTLGPRQSGFQIRAQHCAPVPGDAGYTAMCRYLTDAAPLMDAIEREKPLLGQPLANVFAWRREASPAGCYCEAASREHKWGLVLETIHYALHHQGKNGPER